MVDDGATIGSGTKIWHFCHISATAILGADCKLGQNVFIADGVTIGNNCKIQNNVSVYTGVTLEDDVFLGPSCVLTNVVNPRCEVNRQSEYKETLIKKGATIGANATIVCGVTIGPYAFIAAGAVVTKDVPDFALIQGVPGQHAGWMSRRGFRLEFDDSGTATCKGGGGAYSLTADGQGVSEDEQTLLNGTSSERILL